MNKIAAIGDYKLNIRHDGSLPVAIGKDRFEKNWKNREMAWSALLKRLHEPTRTQETLAEYRAMGKPQQDQIKDVGGFIGGSLKDGRRKSENVQIRQLVTLDADFAPAGLDEDLEMLATCAYAVYSTHKHTPEKPRLRILVPLDRPVTPDEYEAIARKLAEDIGIDYFDDTTYQASRLMYWGSVSYDGEYLFHYEDLPWLKADDVLARYPDWTDTSYWPESSRTKADRVKRAKKQGDPTEKQGLIGAFCRSYTVEEAIEAFLSDVYVKCDMPDRYTYAEGSTAAGLVVYDNGKFAYSNHATDPAGGKLCNAFDLVRIHKFGELDEDAAPDTASTKFPSYKAMVEFVRSDEGTKAELAKSRTELAKEDFADEDPVAWVKRLEYDRKGNLENSLNNALWIMQNDPHLKGIMFNQMADNLEIKGDVPWKHPGKFWRDADDAQLEAFLSKNYAEFPKQKIQTAITKAADDRSYHPVREYLDALPDWDGIPRVDTLLIDYLGAENTEYVRAVTRKTLCGAVMRVKAPGCKFDTVLVLCGPQGIGKSTLVNNLGGQWFSDSLNLADIKDKTAAEKLQGYWIVEMGELAGMGGVGVKTLRSFITTRDDRYRASYGRRVSSHPRQCIFIGTTNSEEGYLNDVDGGRRFWPVNVPSVGNKKVWDMTQEDVDQIWAETLCIVESGESLILSGNIAEEALKRQKDAMVSDPRESLVQEFLETLLPTDWYSKGKGARQDYFSYDTGTPPEDGFYRARVCYQEIWCECFGYPEKTLGVKERFQIRGILERMDGWNRSDKRQRVPGYGIQTVYERVALND